MGSFDPVVVSTTNLHGFHYNKIRILMIKSPEMYAHLCITKFSKASQAMLQGTQLRYAHRIYKALEHISPPKHIYPHITDPVTSG